MEDEIAAGNALPEGEDDTQYMLSQDPGYLLWMEQQRQEWEGEQMQKEHNESLEYFLSRQEFEEEIRREAEYYSGLEDENEE